MFKLSSKEEQKQHELLVKRLEDQVKALEAKLERAETRADNATERLVELASRYDKIVQESSNSARAMEEKLQQLLATQDSTARERTQLEQRLTQTQLELKRVSGEANSNAAKLEAALSRETEVKGKLDAAVSRETEIKGKLDAALSKETELKGKLNAALSRENELKGKLDACLVRERDLGAKLAAAEKKLGDSGAREKAAEARNNGLQEQLSDEKRHSKATQEEKELVLVQLRQIREENAALHLKLLELDREHDRLRGQWARLKNRIPSYVDFTALRINEAIMEGEGARQISIEVSDFSCGSVAIGQLRFKIVLGNGASGLVILGHDQKETNVRLIPKAISGSKAELANFLTLTTSAYGELDAAVTILEYCEKQSWKDVLSAEGVDLQFWRPTFVQLVNQARSLPKILRYDEALLKRELLNPDYEHLWIEIKNVKFGEYECPKFEIRLGAALVQPSGFSSFPKFEFPLLAGKTPPFTSWFPESQDDHGPKLELRFSLEGGNFDLNIWSRLSENDRALLLNLICTFPRILSGLNASQTPIHREWKTWIDFSKEAASIIQKFTKKASNDQPRLMPGGTSKLPNALTQPKSSARVEVIQVPSTSYSEKRQRSSAREGANGTASTTKAPGAKRVPARSNQLEDDSKHEPIRQLESIQARLRVPGVSETAVPLAPSTRSRGSRNTKNRSEPPRTSALSDLAPGSKSANLKSTKSRSAVAKGKLKTA